MVGYLNQSLYRIVWLGTSSICMPDFVEPWSKELAPVDNRWEWGEFGGRSCGGKETGVVFEMKTKFKKIQKETVYDLCYVSKVNGFALIYQ